MSKGPISQFIEKHYLHFNAAALVDAAKGYEEHLLDNGNAASLGVAFSYTFSLGVLCFHLFGVCCILRGESKFLVRERQ